MVWDRPPCHKMTPVCVSGIQALYTITVYRRCTLDEHTAGTHVPNAIKISGAWHLTDGARLAEISSIHLTD